METKLSFIDLKYNQNNILNPYTNLIYILRKKIHTSIPQQLFP